MEDSELIENYNDEKLLDMYKAKGFNVIHFPINEGKKVSKKQFQEIHKIVDELQGGTLFHSDKGGRAMEIKSFYENEAVVE